MQAGHRKPPVVASALTSLHVYIDTLSSFCPCAAVASICPIAERHLHTQQPAWPEGSFYWTASMYRLVRAPHLPAAPYSDAGRPCKYTATPLNHISCQASLHRLEQVSQHGAHCAESSLSCCEGNALSVFPQSKQDLLHHSGAQPGRPLQAWHRSPQTLPGNLHCLLKLRV